MAQEPAAAVQVFQSYLDNADTAHGYGRGRREMPMNYLHYCQQASTQMNHTIVTAMNRIPATMATHAAAR